MAKLNNDDREVQKDVSEFFFYTTGLNFIGKEKAESTDPKVVMVIGLMVCMGQEYARIKKIVTNDVKIDFQNKKIEYIDKSGFVIDSFEITNEDIANPGEWLNCLYKENGIQG